MGKIRLSIILFTIILLISGIKNYTAEANSREDLFKQILECSNGKVIELGIKVEYTIKSGGEDECTRILKNLQIENNINEKVKSKSNESFQFQKGNLSGYIEYMRYDNEDTIVVDICEKSSINNLNELKDKIRNAIDFQNRKVKYFLYLKAGLRENDISTVQRKVIKLLEDNGAADIQPVKLENGWSTVAYTNKYDVRINDGKLFDFNFVVCNYNSGNYIIMGTPEIITAY